MNDPGDEHCFDSPIFIQRNHYWRFSHISGPVAVPSPAQYDKLQSIPPLFAMERTKLTSYRVFPSRVYPDTGLEDGS